MEDQIVLVTGSNKGIGYAAVKGFLHLGCKTIENGFGRIINVSSGAGSFAEMEGASAPAYSISKAALNLLTVKLGKELAGTGIYVNAMCPGWVRTDMGGQAASRSPEKGAETILWLAQLPNEGPTAKFFRDKKEIAF